jgi:hypothetical protein
VPRGSEPVGPSDSTGVVSRRSSGKYPVSLASGALIQQSLDRPASVPGGLRALAEASGGLRAFVQQQGRRADLLR